jgi:ABC-type oligopeptide transport system substrate-binding subunit
MDAYKEAQRILARELPVLPLASSLRLQAYRYDMKGLVLSPSVTLRSLAYRGKNRRGEKTMIIFTLRRLLLLLVTLFF